MTMLNMKEPSNFWNRFLFKSEPTFSRDSQNELKANASLSGNIMEERLVQTDKELMVQRWNEKKGVWMTEYRTKKVIPIEHKILKGYLNAASQQVFIFSCWTGNGGFLTYTIIGREKGKLVKLASNEFVYKGGIYFEDGKLIEKSANRYSEWINKNGRLKLIPYKVPEIPGALRIEYYIFPDGRVKTDTTHFTVPVGTIVQAIRTDLNSEPSRGYLYPKVGQSDDMFEYYYDNSESFKIIKKGKIEMNIFPDDWEKVVPITIEAI